MGRERGTFLNPANYEPLVAAPFDARTLVQTKADLIAAKTWTTVDGDMWIYNGMMTVVCADGVNNGLYILFDKAHFHHEDAWVKIESTDISDLEKVIQTLTERVDNTYTKTEVNELISKIYRVKGSVEKYTDLPADAEIGDVYNILYADKAHGINAGDNVVWTGTEWDRLGGIVDLSDYALLSDLEAIAIAAKYEAYEVVSAPIGALIDTSREKEIRIMCPKDTDWTLQNVGENGDASNYYIGFRAYAPTDDIVSFKEDMQYPIQDNTMHSFENNSFAGIDAYGRKYSLMWLAVARYDAATDTWKYYGENSSTKKFIGWNYSVEWYDANGALVASDTIRINLSNETCHNTIEPYYMGAINVNKLVQTDTQMLVLFGGTATDVN